MCKLANSHAGKVDLTYAYFFTLDALHFGHALSEYQPGWLKVTLSSSNTSWGNWTWNIGKMCHLSSWKSTHLIPRVLKNLGSSLLLKGQWRCYRQLSKVAWLLVEVKYWRVNYALWPVPFDPQVVHIGWMDVADWVSAGGSLLGTNRWEKQNAKLLIMPVRLLHNT